jgi:glucokinase
LEPELDLTIGIDLEGTSTRIGLFDAKLVPIASCAIATRVLAGPEACVAEISSEIIRLLESCGGISKRHIRGIGIGSPGPIDLQMEVLGVLPNFPGWDSFPLKQSLETATGLPVVLESDANAAAIAEWKVGVGKQSGENSLVMLTLGTGVGSGFILNGKVWHGKFGMGVELGHATIVPDGLACGCGSKGCLEMYASSKGLLTIARGVAHSELGTFHLKELVERPSGFTPEDLAIFAQSAHGAGARFAYEMLGKFLGIGLANLISTLDPPVIIIGGGLAGSWSLFAPAMFEAILEHSFVYRLSAPSQIDTLEPNRTFICPASLGCAAGLIGAALLPRLTTAP